jgi:spermidine synthase
VRALHLGGGGYTIPRYLEATRPGSQSHVLEIDPGVSAIAEKRLGLVLGRGITTDARDGRVGLTREVSGSRDVVIGDAFGGVAVPWHLATRESVRQVARVLTRDGIYAANVIDHPPLSFVRAEVATIAAEFGHVAIAATAETFTGTDGGNLVVLASHAPLPVERIAAGLRERVPEWTLLAGAEQIAAFVGDARVLTDDFAPVDQLLTPYPPAASSRVGSASD